MLFTLSRRIFLAFIMALALTLIVAILGRGQGMATAGQLPPRPTPTPTAVPAVPINGATIRLHTSGSMPGAWTMIEWQSVEIEFP